MICDITKCVCVCVCVFCMMSWKDVQTSECQSTNIFWKQITQPRDEKQINFLNSLLHL